MVLKLWLTNKSFPRVTALKGFVFSRSSLESIYSQSRRFYTLVQQRKFLFRSFLYQWKEVFFTLIIFWSILCILNACRKARVFTVDFSRVLKVTDLFSIVVSCLLIRGWRRIKDFLSLHGNAYLWVLSTKFHQVWDIHKDNNLSYFVLMEFLMFPDSFLRYDLTV